MKLSLWVGILYWESIRMCYAPKSNCLFIKKQQSGAQPKTKEAASHITRCGLKFSGARAQVRVGCCVMRVLCPRKQPWLMERIHLGPKTESLVRKRTQSTNLNTKKCACVLVRAWTLLGERLPSADRGVRQRSCGRRRAGRVPLALSTVIIWLLNYSHNERITF